MVLGIKTQVPVFQENNLFNFTTNHIFNNGFIAQENTLMDLRELSKDVHFKTKVDLQEFVFANKRTHYQILTFYS